MSNDYRTLGAARIVLVTGGAGFIGSHLADALLERGVTVRVLDNFHTGSRQNLNPRIELIEADIRERATLEPAFAGVDCVFHAAALPRVGLSIEQPLETHLVNVVGTLNVLLAARAAGVRRVVYSGSSSVYGEQSGEQGEQPGERAPMPLRETMTPNPLSPYALQKLMAEEYVRMFHRLYGLGALSLRYFSVYGPRMDLEGAYATVIGAFLRARREGRPLEIRGDGGQRRDFTHVRDVVRANLAAMDSALDDGSAINVGRGHAVSVNLIAEIVGGPRVNVAPRPGEPRDTLADLGRSRAILGWSPEVDIEDGVRELLRLYGL
ncbi:MAG TPA: NAD-dependent epimerase/dehydratase family protein [Candidatus Binataceae bacterium]|nr:NAD-dependent epimerase/dehydratase family protein [Candidatus Binataceae bacterium]